MITTGQPGSLIPPPLPLLAADEFKAYLQKYPSGKFAENAAAWLAALEVIQQSAEDGK